MITWQSPADIAYGTPLSATQLNAVANVGGSFAYSPSAGTVLPVGNGQTLSVTFTPNDTANYNNAIASVLINVINDTPITLNDSYSVNEDTTLNIAAPGVLANDTDASGALTAALVTATSQGSLTLNSNGSFSYTPNANFSGSDSFTYKANDGVSDSNVATVTITVNPINDAPVANNDSYNTNEDSALNVSAPGVLSNDTDIDSPSLTAVLVSGPNNGSLTLNPDGWFSYTPNLNFNGSDSFTYKANDGTADSNVATVTIGVDAVNDAPVAANDTYVTHEDTPLSVGAPGVLANDNDAADGTTTLTAVLVTGPSNGALSFNPDGSFSYTPNLNFNGTDSFTYKAKDAGNLQSNEATVTITVAAVNDAPIAQNDNYNTNEDTPLLIAAPGVLANDNDTADGSTTLTAALVTTTTMGSLTLSPDGSFEYAPNANFNGNDSFTYQAVDEFGLQSNTVTVTIAVNAINDAPVAENDSYSTNEDTQIVMPAPGVLFNDTDIDSATLTASLVSGPLFGTLTLESDGSFTYTPNPNFNGNDSFSYKAGDGTYYSNVAMVTLTVNAINDGPLAVGQSLSTNEDTPVIITLSGSDIDSGSLTFSVVTGPSNGILGSLSSPGCSPDGGGSSCTATVSYSPNGNFHGSDSFTFRVNDGGLNSLQATVSITVNPVNDAPIAQGQSVTTDEDVAKSIMLGAVDLDGDSLAYLIVTQPANGSLSGAGPNLTYTPTANFHGADSFTFKVNDGTADSNIATVTINVNPVNDAPLANAGGPYSVNEGDTVVLAGGGSDVDGGPLTFAWDLDNNGSFETTGQNPTFSAVGRNGPAVQTVVLNVCDDHNVCSTSIATVNILNVAPSVSAGGPYNVNEGASVALAGTASDAGGDPLTYAWDLDNDGSFETAGQYPTFSAAGRDGPAAQTVVLKVCDDVGDCGTSSATVNILNVAPVAALSGPASANEGDVKQFTFSVSDAGPDGFSVTAGAPSCGAGASFVAGSLSTHAGGGSFSCKFLDGSQSPVVSIQLTDDDGANSNVATATVSVANLPPALASINAPLDPVQVNTSIAASADFTDPGTLDTHTAQWNWANGITAGIVTEANGSGNISGSYTYANPGIYTVTLTATDKDGGQASQQFKYVVVYDPNGSFVTGGGWFDSPLGAYTADPSLIGKANFGFVSKYKKGTTIPSGDTEFQFHAGDLNFHSSTYEWLVVAGPRAQFKGTGTINGGGNYGFMLTAIDGQISGGGGMDKFRIKIWDKDNFDAVVYDNDLGTDDDAPLTTILGGGSIVIHTGGKK